MAFWNSFAFIGEWVFPVIEFSLKRFSSACLKHASSRIPSLHWHYPASSLLRTHPTPDRASTTGPPRFLDCSFDARHPILPRRARRLLFLSSSPSVLASSSPTDWPLLLCVTRLNWVHCIMAYAFVQMRLRRDGLLHPALIGLRVSEAFHTANSFQFARTTRLVLAHQRAQSFEGFSPRSQRTLR